MSTGHRFLTDYGKAISPGGDYVIAPPSSGDTFVQRGIAFGTSTVGAGTYKLPDNGLPMYVKATGAVTIQNQASATEATLGSGDIGLFIPNTSTTWNVSVFSGSHTSDDEAGSISTDLGDSGVTTDVESVSGALNAVFAEVGVKHVDVPLPILREVSTMAVGNIAAIGGLLASDTTPILGPINGATAGCQRVSWASSNNDVVMFQVSLPDNLDDTLDITLGARIASGGTTNAVGFTVTSYFGETGAAVSDTTGTNQTATYSTVTATIAAADVPAGARTMTVTLTPVAHTTDTCNLTALWLEVPVTINGF